MISRKAIGCVGALVVVAAAWGCGEPAPAAPRENPAPVAPPNLEPQPGPEPEPWSDAWLLADVDRYLGDQAFRRDVLERSLTNADNLYSRTRLSSYARSDQGWDALPVWIPRSEPVTAATEKTLQAGQTLQLTTAATPLWDGTRPTSMDEWVELGQRAFFEYPLRPEVFAEHALANPEVAASVGLSASSDGTWPGFVAFEDLDGRARVGITCALCHVHVQDGEVVVGRARRGFDYGQMRLAYHRDENVAIPDDVAARMAGWGPGRADITEDDDEDPVAIPDLWGLRSQTYLTQAATIRHVHPAALAIRQETQILHANKERTRPPREVAWAMAMYVYSLQPPPPTAAQIDVSAVEAGEGLFGKHCRRCHDNEAFGGDPLPAKKIGVDPSLAMGAARGTGLYRPSPLVRVAEAAPYLHQGTVPSLDDLLSPRRFESDYDAGPRGPGPIAGHGYGTSLPPTQREELIAYLRTL